EDHSQVTRDRPWSLSCTSREPDFFRDSQRGPVKSIEALISRNVEIKTPWLSSYFCGNGTGGDLKFLNLLFSPFLTPDTGFSLSDIGFSLSISSNIEFPLSIFSL